MMLRVFRVVLAVITLSGAITFTGALVPLFLSVQK